MNHGTCSKLKSIYGTGICNTRARAKSSRDCSDVLGRSGYKLEDSKWLNLYPLTSLIVKTYFSFFTDGTTDPTCMLTFRSGGKRETAVLAS